MKKCYFSKRFPKEKLSPETLEKIGIAIADFNRLQRTVFQREVREKRRFAPTLSAPSESLHLRMKKGFQLGDYYTNSALQNAKALISSQTELKSLYQKQTAEKITKLKKKIKDVKNRKTTLQKIKDSLKTGILQLPKNSHWQANGSQVYSAHRGKLKRGSHSLVFFNLYDFEIQYVNKELKRLKQRLGALSFRLNRLAEKLVAFDTNIPGAVFGGKKTFKAQFQCKTDKQKKKWKEAYSAKRNKRMRISGRKDAKYGNFVFQYDPESQTLHMALPNKEPIVFEGVSFPYGQEQLDEAVKTQTSCKNKKKFGKSIAWEIEDHGAYYLFKTILEVAPVAYKNHSRATGILSVDCNADHFAWSDVSGDGNYLDSGLIPFSLAGKTTGQIIKILEQKTIELVAIARQANKSLAIEILDTTLVKTGNRYGNKNANRIASLFAYRKMIASIKSRADREGIEVFEVKAAFTSISGKFKHMRRLGISIHESASFTIGRRALGYKEKLPRFLKPYLKEATKGKHHWSQWSELNRMFDLPAEKIRSLYNLHFPTDGLNLTHLTETERLKIRKVL